MNSTLVCDSVKGLGSVLLIVVATGALHGAPLVLAGSQLVSPPPFLPNSFWAITSSIDRAFPFSVIGGGPYRIDQLQIAAHHYPNLAGNTAEFSIHRDESGRPGAVVGMFQFNNINTTERIVSASPTAELVLNSATPYWLVGSTTRGQVNWNLGFNVFDRVAYRVGSEDWTFIERGNVSAFALLGSAVPEPGSLAIVVFAFIAMLTPRRSRGLTGECSICAD
jgi:hypothetical protein